MRGLEEVRGIRLRGTSYGECAEDETEREEVKKRVGEDRRGMRGKSEWGKLREKG